eukprot:scaffold7909_cov36-Prasinocladus_malaysianus.AAC.4
MRVETAVLLPASSREEAVAASSAAGAHWSFPPLSRGGGCYLEGSAGKEGICWRISPNNQTALDLTHFSL